MCSMREKESWMSPACCVSLPGLRNKAPQSELAVLNNRNLLFIVLEAASPRLLCRLSWFLLKAAVKHLSGASVPGSDVCRCLWQSLAWERSLVSSPIHLHTVFSLSMCLCPNFPFLIRSPVTLDYAHRTPE